MVILQHYYPYILLLLLLIPISNACTNHIGNTYYLYTLYSFFFIVVIFNKFYLEVNNIRQAKNGM